MSELPFEVEWQLLMGYSTPHEPMTGRAEWVWLAAIGIGITAGAVSCALDTRTFLIGGASAGSAAVAAGGGSSSAGGEAGETGQPLPVCDYASGVLAGCETLVKNPGFTKDTFGWVAEDPTVTMSWAAGDADANHQSGSISVANSLFGTADGIASRGAAQCLPTEPGKAYGFAGDIFIPKGQGSGLDGGSYQGSAGLSVIFYTGAHCNEYTLSNATSVLLEEEGNWAHREGRGVAPSGAQSMLVRLVAFKNFREYSFEAHFDNVLIKGE